MNLENLSYNKRKSKKREFNEFGKVTTLIKQYKISNKEVDLLEIIQALEGIVNTYTIMLTPGDVNQQIYITPYMKKFLGMFLTPDERLNANIVAYNQAISRVRWIMRQYEYEDIYSHILCILIHTIKTMKIVGTCDCIYYIQLIVRFKLHDFVIKNAKDACVNIAQIPTSHEEEEDLSDAADRIACSADIGINERELINSFYDELDISILARYDDIFKCLSRYEKYLIYLKDSMQLTNRQIITILRFEDDEELRERFEDIRFKLELINQEGD
jgi:hypothetical protein